MKIKSALCVAFSMMLLLTAGCQRDSNNHSKEAETTYEVVNANLGESATYGGMTLTVESAEDPDILMSSGKKAMFFKVTINNETDETVTASYLNNFSLTVNGNYYESDECCTIPVMKELYDFYGEEALNTELEPNMSCTGYVACEVDSKYDIIDLHYIPKTTDRASRITVSLNTNNVVPVSK